VRRGAIAVLMMAAAQIARAQGGFVLQGVADVESWKTDTLSTALRRNEGRLALLHRVHLWSAVEPVRGVYFFASGLLEGGSAKQFGGMRTTTVLDQGGVRIARTPAIVVNAGRMVHPVGAFGARILSTRNPLIGTPDAYIPVYPVGVMASGEWKKLDYRVASISLPPTHPGYTPRPLAAQRPMAGIGISPTPALRVAVSATDGPYLNDEIGQAQLAGKPWQSYHQRVLAGDLKYGVGHFDLLAELAFAEFDVPNNPEIGGAAGYAEARMTISPRVFVAVRGEFNRYPFIRPTGTTWISRQTEFRGAEAGGGFRFGANTLLKATVAIDDWVVTPENSTFIRPGGKALVVQLSRAFDLRELRR
jgi:hypothetical protein